MLRTVVRATFNEGCCECVARVPSMLRTRLRATSNIGRLSSTSPTCCDHVATMLRPCCDLCCVQHPTSGALPPLLLDTTPNIKCLQHRNSTSATFAKSQRNIKMHMSQHVRVDKTQETKCCNIIKTTTHVVCNIQHQELPLLLDTQTSHVCNNENSTSATLKFNVCNPTTCVCNIKTRRLQHRNSTSATVKHLNLLLQHPY
jgi:hypothetical protein